MAQTRRAPTGLALSSKAKQYKLVSADETILRQAIFDTLSRFIGKREGRINNDAPWIREINGFWGLPPLSHYCASSLAFGHAKNGVFLPWIPLISVGRVNAYFRNSVRLVYVRGQRGNSRSILEPRFMDWVSLYASHTEAFAERKWDPEAQRYLCLGFNTGTPGGCYLVYRHRRDINAIANHLTPFLTSL